MLYVSQAGLDLHTPTSARHYLHLCAKGHEDIYCKAMQIEAQKYKDPLSILTPDDTGDRARTAVLVQYLAKHGFQRKDFLENAEIRSKFFKAHAFAMAQLTTGQHQTLDGKFHNIQCQNKQHGVYCMLNGLQLRNYTQRPFPDGQVYRVYLNKQNQNKWQDFYSFLDQ